MRIALSLGGALSPKSAVALAREAEAAGFAVVGFGDGLADAVALCAAAAAETTRIGIRTGVATLGRSPVQTAIAAGTLQRLSGGRFRLGLGPGSRGRVEGWHGRAWGPPAARFADYARALRAALHGDAAYSGPYERFAGFGGERFAVPLDLAANGAAMLRAAAPLADSLLLDHLLTPDLLRTRIGGIRALGGPGLEVSVSLYAAIGAREASALAAARGAVTFSLRLGASRDSLAGAGFPDAALSARGWPANAAPPTSDISDDLVDAFTVVGPARALRLRLEAWRGVADEVRISAIAWQGAESEAASRAIITAMA